MAASGEIEYSFAREVWKRYRRSFSAMSGLGIILFFCLAAICAPLLANRLPLLVRMDGSWSSPAFRALFNPDSTEILVSKTFNFLLLFLPAAAVLKLIFRKRKKLFWWLAVSAAILLLVPFFQLLKH